MLWLPARCRRSFPRHGIHRSHSEAMHGRRSEPSPIQGFGGLHFGSPRGDWSLSIPQLCRPVGTCHRALLTSRPAKREQSGPKVTKTASSVLPDPGASRTAKSLAGSALAQANTSKRSSARTATTAAKSLNDCRTSSATRTLAGSMLTQKPSKKLPTCRCPHQASARVFVPKLRRVLKFIPLTMAFPLIACLQNSDFAFCIQ